MPRADGDSSAIEEWHLVTSNSAAWDAPRRASDHRADHRQVRLTLPGSRPSALPLDGYLDDAANKTWTPRQPRKRESGEVTSKNFGRGGQQDLEASLIIYRGENLSRNHFWTNMYTQCF